MADDSWTLPTKIDSTYGIIFRLHYMNFDEPRGKLGVILSVPTV